jgi:hypothetical protein
MVSGIARGLSRLIGLFVGAPPIARQRRPFTDGVRAHGRLDHLQRSPE